MQIHTADLKIIFEGKTSKLMQGTFVKSRKGSKICGIHQPILLQVLVISFKRIKGGTPND